MPYHDEASLGALTRLRQYEDRCLRLLGELSAAESAVAMLDLQLDLIRGMIHLVGAAGASLSLRKVEFIVLRIDELLSNFERVNNPTVH